MAQLKGEKYCQKCEKYFVQKGFRLCSVCKVQTEKAMEKENFLQQTHYLKIHRSRGTREGSERDD
jgi:hypothetical protein